VVEKKTGFWNLKLPEQEDVTRNKTLPERQIGRTSLNNYTRAVFYYYHFCIRERACERKSGLDFAWKKNSVGRRNLSSGNEPKQ
jgi:hypothetical protein